MKNTNYLLSVLAAASVAMGQSSDSAGCSNVQISSCLLAVTPAGLVPASTATNLQCGDQACVCSAMSSEAECYRTYCTDFDTANLLGPEYTSECGQILGLGKITGSASLASKTAPSANTATVTSAPGKTTTAAAAASSSTAKGQGMGNVVPTGGLLAVLIGMIAIW